MENNFVHASYSSIPNGDGSFEYGVMISKGDLEKSNENVSNYEVFPSLKEAANRSFFINNMQVEIKNIELVSISKYNTYVQLTNLKEEYVDKSSIEVLNPATENLIQTDIIGFEKNNDDIIVISKDDNGNEYDCLWEDVKLDVKDREVSSFEMN